MWLVDAASPSNWGDRVFYWRGTEGYSTPARSPWRRWVESSLRYADACLMPPLWPPGRLGHVSLRAGPRTNQSNAADIHARAVCLAKRRFDLAQLLTRRMHAVQEYPVPALSAWLIKAELQS